MEKQHKRGSDRYQELVDRKHIQGLTPAEADEMRSLGQQIDDYYAPIYEGILAGIRDREATDWEQLCPCCSGVAPMSGGGEHEGNL